jgi:hypothetical protein
MELGEGSYDSFLSISFLHEDPVGEKKGDQHRLDDAHSTAV